MHSLNSQKNDHPSIEVWLKNTYPEQSKLRESGLVHRLDERTSGCLMAARTEAAYEFWSEHFQSENIRVKKIYLALVEGRIGSGKFEIYFSGRYKRSKKVSVLEKGEASERGFCRWKLSETRTPSPLLEVEIVGPGRRHQIRAGFAYLGHPLLGDSLYGGRDFPVLALHAWKLIIGDLTHLCPIPQAWIQ